MSAPLIEMRAITKSFGAVKANEAVDLSVAQVRSSACWAKTAPARRR
ncbi:hypothetical protein [Mesorhizobium sp. C264A]